MEKNMDQISKSEVMQQREQLQRDAEKAKTAFCPELTQGWVEPQKWSRYTGPAGETLYLSFSDEELLNIIRREAVALGRTPAQREVFCVYREFIRRRFGNWVKALCAAGLREPKTTRKRN